MLDVRRYFYCDSGRLAGDMVFDVNAPGDPSREVIVDPADDLRQKNLAGLCSETLLEPLARDGGAVLDAAGRDALAARARGAGGARAARREPEAHAEPAYLSCGPRIWSF